MNEQRNLILAIAISIAVLVGFDFVNTTLNPPVTPPQTVTATPGTQTGQTSTATPSGGATADNFQADGLDALFPVKEVALDRETALSHDPRIVIDAQRIHGSLSLKGARIDDLSLRGYHETPDPDSPEIQLLHPYGLADSYYVQFGWFASDKNLKLPTPQTEWDLVGNDKLTPETPVTLQWDNGQGLIFRQNISVDQNYMFHVTQSVQNNTDAVVRLAPYGRSVRSGEPEILDFFILHEGFVGGFNGEIDEQDYSDVKDADRQNIEFKNGRVDWLGITDKYWLVALIPDLGDGAIGNYRFTNSRSGGRYQVDFAEQAAEIAPNQIFSQKAKFFAGAKEVSLLETYRDQENIPLFERAVDFGWLYFITEPFFKAISWLYKLIGNFGVAIIVFTLGIKIIFFPLANKSYKSMSKMKLLQPEMVKLRERCGDDKMKMQQEMMGLYKKHKVNPASGCLPIVIQIPVFFALYKVLFVTIEMRHAPFFGWITDLSAPDPTTIFNLFGLIPWSPPDFLMIGIWPLIMGLTMWLQQKLNPSQPDPIQQKIFMMLPIVFTFMLAQFPSGLVIYWAVNNTLSILQQWVIMRQVAKQEGKA